MENDSIRRACCIAARLLEIIKHENAPEASGVGPRQQYLEPVAKKRGIRPIVCRRCDKPANAINEVGSCWVHMVQSLDGYRDDLVAPGQLLILLGLPCSGNVSSSARSGGRGVKV